jgi:hypothetical protein
MNIIMQIFKLYIVKFLFLLLFLSIISCASTNNDVNENELSLNQDDLNQEVLNTEDLNIEKSSTENEFGLTSEPQKEPTSYSDSVTKQKYTALDYKNINESLLKKIKYKDVDLDVAEKNNNFVLDTLINYKGIPVVVLRVKSPNEYRIEKLNEVNTADDYLSVRKADKKDVRDVFLTQDHKNLLDSFINTTKGSNKVLILMYARAINFKSSTKDDFMINRIKYQQSVLTYLYTKLKNVRIEQRFLEDLPDDEIFLTAFNYEGSFANNVYSVPKASGLEWLQALLNYQLELVGAANKNKIELEETLLKTGTPANKTRTQNKLPTPK